MTQIRLLGERLHLRPLSFKPYTESGIILLEKYHDDRMRYQVLGCGPRVNPDIQPGMYCLIPFLQDSVDLGDGTVVVKANQVQMLWFDNPDLVADI